MGVHKNQFKSVASIKISAYFDVFSKIITQFQIFDKRKADLLCCIESQVKNLPKNVIAVYDRAYGSQILPFFHALNGSKYVIRLKTDFSNTVKKFAQSSDNDATISEAFSERNYKRLEEFGIRKSQKDIISYRLVKVILNTGEIEILMTNLDSLFTINDLSEIYPLRWEIETAFNSIKNHQMLGTFSGYSELAIRQDIWCNLIFYNLQTITMLEAETEAKRISERVKNKISKRKKKENRGYQINRNVGTGILRSCLSGLLFCRDKDLSYILEKNENFVYAKFRDCQRYRQGTQAKNAPFE